MGLFGSKEICSICNEQESNKKLQDGCICKKCMQKCVPFILTFSWKDETIERVHKAHRATEKNDRLIALFKPTKKVDKYIGFDENNKLWKIDASNVIFEYNEIISFELLEDGDIISKGGLGSAIAGGALFGGVGAIVGGVTGSKKSKVEVRELGINIFTRNDMCPKVYINLLKTGPVKSGGMIYNGYKNSAQKIIAELTLVTDSLKNENSQGSQTAFSEADEIAKFKKLFDDGVITQEEFETKKKQLLGL